MIPHVPPPPPPKNPNRSFGNTAVAGRQFMPQGWQSSRSGLDYDPSSLAGGNAGLGNNRMYVNSPLGPQFKPSTPPPLSSSSVPNAAASSSFHRIKSPVPTQSFRNQLLSVINWMNNLNEDEATEALSSILENFPYGEILSHCVRTAYNGSVLQLHQSRTPLSLEASTDNLRISDTHTFNPSPIPSRIGAIGQERPQSAHAYHSGTHDDFSKPVVARASMDLSRVGSPLLEQFMARQGGFQQHQQNAAAKFGRPRSVESAETSWRAQEKTISQSTDNWRNASAVWLSDSADMSGASRLRHPIPQRRPQGDARGATSSNGVSSQAKAYTPPPKSGSPQIGKSGEKGRIPEEVDFSLLNDIPSWLKSLRLHKYTYLFVPDFPRSTTPHQGSEEEDDEPEGAKKLWKWHEMVELNDEELEKMGVKALGARRKMLKVFELVKEQRNM
ncbi:hypothetical protein MP638_000646 [Amoeboaphelidium occidentale]|nr:hypothetical protein MP638_000646 [Amoeboaphelidium occidentale]